MASQKLVVITAVLAMATSEQSLPADTNSWTVAVAISADDVMASPLRSCINQELRNLGDVRIVEDVAEITVRVVALQSIVGGREVGYVASSVVLDHTKAHILLDNQAETLNTAKAIADKIKAGRFVFPPEIASMGHVQSHVVFTDSELTSICKRIVAAVDVDAIEPRRGQSN